MAGRIMQERSAEVREAAAALGATVADSGARNTWEVAVAGKHAGKIRHDPRARLWLATTGTETTIGDLAGCLQFVIRRC
jgi:hypothetical protein